MKQAGQEAARVRREVADAEKEITKLHRQLEKKVRVGEFMVITMYLSLLLLQQPTQIKLKEQADHLTASLKQSKAQLEKVGHWLFVGVLLKHMLISFDQLKADYQKQQDEIAKVNQELKEAEQDEENLNELLETEEGKEIKLAEGRLCVACVQMRLTIGYV